MANVELKPVHRTADYEDFWDGSVTGYDTIEWESGGETVKESFLFDRYIAFEGDVEVARVDVEPQRTLNVKLSGLDTSEPVVDVAFIEVVAHRRRTGVGAAVVAEVVKQYPGRLVIAFSHADDFWSGIGWTRFERLDGADGNAPLFATFG